jgi:hypothetical protein
MATEGSERMTVRQEIPVDEIKEAMKNYPEVIMMIRRRNIRGSWASVGPSVRKATEELLEIADFCREIAGGGKFKIDALDPNDKTRHVVPPFEFENEGQERPSKLTTSGAPGFSPGADPRRPPQWGPPGPPVIIDRGGDADAAGIAQEHARDYRGDFQTEKTAREQDRERFERTLADLNTRIAETEKRAAQELQRERERHAEERFRVLEAKLAAPPPKPAFDAAAIAALATPVVTLITAVIEAGKTRSQLQAEGLERSVSTQLSLVRDLVAKKPDDGGTTKLMEMFMPLVKASMEERSPSKIAELVSAQADASMQTLSIVSQFIDKMAPEESDNPWVDMARNAVNSITKAAQEMSAYSRQAVGGSPRLGTGANGAAQQQQLAPDATPKQIADAIYKAPGLPKGLKTPDWYEVFFELHIQTDPTEISKKMAHLLENADPTPPPFTGLFEDENNPPSHYLATFLQQLPVWQQNPQYAQAVMRAFDGAFGTEGDDNADGDQGTTAAAAPERVVVTPRPQPVVRPPVAAQQPFAEPAVIDTTASENS